MRKKNQKNPSGTTLIEVIVALAVIAITIEGAAFVASIAFRASESNKTRLIASNLAYEGIDVVSKAISTNKIRFSDSDCWNFDMDNEKLPCEKTKILEGKYRLEDYSENGMSKTKLIFVDEDLIVGDSQNQSLNEEYLISLEKVGTDEFYTYGDPSRTKEGKKTKFYRIIEIKYGEIGGKEDELVAASTVAWNEGGGQKTISAEDIFYNDFSHD